MISFYRDTTFECGKIIATSYSTSFSIGIRMLKKEFRNPVYAVYGYVRIADEIVDTFHGYNKEALIKEFRHETYKAIERGISTNPVINCFQETVRKYNIDIELIDAFLDSMEMDLAHSTYDPELYRKYLYGSAEVVGLMCLKVFCDGDDEMYQRLRYPAQMLGSAFQKINFLRDMKSDYDERNRVYFPGVDYKSFDRQSKLEIEQEIGQELDAAKEGMRNLPPGSKFGVYVAYKYFDSLFKKIISSDPEEIKKGRIRVNNFAKLCILCFSAFRYKFGTV